MKKRIFEIIQIGNRKDTISKVFDIFITVAIFLNLAATMTATFDEAAAYMPVLNGIELVTSIIFLVEYCLRIWTADCLYPDKRA